MAVGLWILERCASERFPYRLRLLNGGKPWLTLRVQDRWPTANRNIFCLRERESSPPADAGEVIEQVPIVALQRRGRRVSVVLDRKRLKRCDFLFLAKRYKGAPDANYEQIFWQTQQALRQRRPRAGPPMPSPPTDLIVRIASDERAPWRFTGWSIVRGPLPAGDYALLDGDDLVAVVERKTFQNLLSDLAVLPLLHQRLLELASYRHHALVVEAPYEQFLDEKKNRYYAPAFCARAIAEFYAAHPSLRIVFCANRKTANAWTQRYFAAVWAERQRASDGGGRGMPLPELE